MVQKNLPKFYRFPYYIASLHALLGSVHFLPILTIKKLVFYRPYQITLSFHSVLDLLVAKEVILDQEYESLFVHVEHDDKVIVDVGAGFGDFSISVAKRYSSATVVAVEIDPTYLALLRKNIQENNVSTIHVIDRPISLFELIKRYKRIDFFKMDCEGCEYDMINDHSLPALKKIKKLSMEYHEFEEKTKEMIVNLLYKAGFTVDIIPTCGVPHVGHIKAKR